MDIGGILMDFSKKIKALTLELTKILSVVGTSDENHMPHRIYDWFMELDYFKDNPRNLRFLDVIDDPLKRKSLMAIVEGKKNNSKNTVVLIGHTDTVGIEDFGHLKEYANKPLELMKNLKEVSLSKEAKEDLESGNYLFGRGIFDMKCGVATLMVIMEEIINNIENLEGNIIFGAVCDEEGNSGGMLSLVPELVRLQEENNYDYLAVIDTDYSAPRYVGDETRYVYVGTVGKLMPSFYIVGKETHVGEPYKGLDPNEISAGLVKEFNLNMEYCDVAEGEVALPPITLRQQDLKTEYSVQIAKTSYLYFNYATHTSTPDEVMEKILKGSKKAFSKVIHDLNHQYEGYCKMSGYPYERLPWEPRSISFHELLERVRTEKGDEVDRALDKLSEELLKDTNIDERIFALKMVEKVHSMWSDREPIIIAYFSPPYYPHIYVKGTNEKEKSLMDSINKAIDNAGDKYDIKMRKFYPYISDLSYAAAPREKDVVNLLRNNMPGYGTRYNLPLEEMQSLNLPVVNIGPFGKDAHKFTERVEVDYSFTIAPKIVYDTIMNLLDN